MTTRWQIQRQRGFDWVPFDIYRDGVLVAFPTRRAAMEYWYDDCGPHGRNDHCRYVKVTA